MLTELQNAITENDITKVNAILNNPTFNKVIMKDEFLKFRTIINEDTNPAIPKSIATAGFIMELEDL